MVGTRVTIVILLLAGLPAPALAQVSATTGAINGKVSDATGGVLPGVSVTIASPSMQGTRTDVTNVQGDYRFPAVPPGEYRISVTATAKGEAVAVDPLTLAKVTGIAPTANGTMVTLGALGTVALADILEIN